MGPDIAYLRRQEDAVLDRIDERCARALAGDPGRPEALTLYLHLVRGAIADVRAQRRGRLPHDDGSLSLPIGGVA